MARRITGHHELGSQVAAREMWIEGSVVSELAIGRTKTCMDVMMNMRLCRAVTDL